MSILITGGTGFIGATLSRKLLERGHDVVLFDVEPNYKIINDIQDGVKIIRGDITLPMDILDVVKRYEVKDVFHLAALLSDTAEKAPLSAFRVNVEGTVNVLEAAKLFDIKKVVFTSSMAVYGPGLPEPTCEDVPLQSRSVYGITKIFCELWGLYYHRHYGIDFRAVRFPSVIGLPRRDGGVSAYTSLVVRNPVLGEPYEVTVDEDAILPLLYYKDAANALITLYEAKEPESRIYNISGISLTARELVDAVKKHIPDAVLKFTPKPEIVSIVDSVPSTLDDTKAREELGWKLSYPLEDIIKEFISEAKSGYA